MKKGLFFQVLMILLNGRNGYFFFSKNVEGSKDSDNLLSLEGSASNKSAYFLSKCLIFNYVIEINL